MCKSIRATHETKQVPTDAAEELEKETTVEPTESDHPKCEELVVANGKWSLTRIEPQEDSLRRKLDTSTLRKIIYCMQFPSYGIRYVQLHAVVPTTRDQKTRQVVAYKRLKTKTVKHTESDHPKCEDLVVANGRWSLTRIEPREVSLRRKPDTSTLRKRIYCMQFPSYDMCSSMLMLFLPQGIAYKSLKTMQNH